MFNSFARYDALRRRDPAAALPLGDGNRRRTHLSASAQSRDSLACYWQQNAEAGRLECHWTLSSNSAARALERGLPPGTGTTPSWTLRVA
jgi:hypothetical protein